jgi:hypothetical protein
MTTPEQDLLAVINSLPEDHTLQPAIPLPPEAFHHEILGTKLIPKLTYAEIPNLPHDSVVKLLQKAGLETDFKKLEQENPKIGPFITEGKVDLKNYVLFLFKKIANEVAIPVNNDGINMFLVITGLDTLTYVETDMGNVVKFQILSGGKIIHNYDNISGVGHIYGGGSLSYQHKLYELLPQEFGVIVYAINYNLKPEHKDTTVSYFVGINKKNSHSGKQVSTESFNTFMKAIERYKKLKSELAHQEITQSKAKIGQIRDIIGQYL